MQVHLSISEAVNNNNKLHNYCGVLELNWCNISEGIQKILKNKNSKIFLFYKTFSSQMH